MTLLAPLWTRSLTSFQREMHVFVFVRVEENERSNREGTGFRGQINNGLLTATLLPVICMQRSVEKVNVQKDTNSTIISRPENTLHHTLRHERNSCGFTNILHTVTAHFKQEQVIKKTRGGLILWRDTEDNVCLSGRNLPIEAGMWEWAWPRLYATINSICGSAHMPSS